MASTVGTIKYQNGSKWVDILHPVGSFYFSTEDISPSMLFGGTWAAVANATLRGSTTVGYVGNDTHTITKAEMPNHYHVFDGAWGWTVSIGFNTGHYNIPTRTDLTGNTEVQENPTAGGGKQCRLSSVLTTALFGTELRRFFGGGVNGIY
jgi:hypothetical protein